MSNRPLTFADPTGHFPLGLPGVGGGGPFTFSVNDNNMADPDQSALVMNQPAIDPQVAGGPDSGISGPGAPSQLDTQDQSSGQDTPNGQVASTPDTVRVAGLFSDSKNDRVRMARNYFKYNPTADADGRLIDPSKMSDEEVVKAFETVAHQIQSTAIAHPGYNPYTVMIYGGAVGASGAIKPSSPNQMNQQWRRGQAPNGIGRTDVGKVTGEQQHTIIEGKGAINIDGTWKHGGGTLTRDQAAWLRANGYNIK